ncbi:MAG: glutaredoxin family protein [Gammaproteobacteria bacterium]
MTELVLYTTVGCHLCDQAEAMLHSLRAQHPFRLLTTDIANDEALMERYGMRIPVVRNEARAQELGWPFQPEDLLKLF